MEAMKQDNNPKSASDGDIGAIGKAASERNPVDKSEVCHRDCYATHATCAHLKLDAQRVRFEA